MYKYIIFLIVVVGLIFFIIYPPKFNIGGSFSGAGVTNKVVVVGTNASESATVLSLGDVTEYAKICLNGIGDTTLCYASTCTFDSGIKLSTTTNNICHVIEPPSLYIGIVTARVSATTTPSTTSTLGIIFK